VPRLGCGYQVDRQVAGARLPTLKVGDIDAPANERGEVHTRELGHANVRLDTHAREAPRGKQRCRLPSTASDVDRPRRLTCERHEIVYQRGWITRTHSIVELGIAPKYQSLL
jgi:hypothetical protein